MIKVKKCRSVEERSGLEMRCLMDNETKRAESLFLAGEFAESLSLLKELAKDPANGRDQYLLGLFYFYAVEVRWNGDRFLELVHSGWRAGDVLSGFFILYRDGEGNKKEMTEKYVEHMKKLLPMAKAGDPFAMRQIAILYERGLGRKINMDQAYDWYVCSAEKGLCLSMADAGRIAMDESFSRYDPKLAFTWFLKGAALGYHEAELRLGDCFYGAIGVEEDKEKAATCFERASNHGNGEASDALGTMYVLGDGISQDMDKAYEFFRAQSRALRAACTSSATATSTAAGQKAITKKRWISTWPPGIREMSLPGDPSDACTFWGLRRTVMPAKASVGSRKLLIPAISMPSPLWATAM